MAFGGIRGIPKWKEEKRKEHQHKSIEELEEKLEELENKNIEYYCETTQMGFMVEKDVIENLIEHKKSKGLDEAEKYINRAFDDLKKAQKWIETAREHIEGEE